MIYSPLVLIVLSLATTINITSSECTQAFEEDSWFGQIRQLAHEGILTQEVHRYPEYRVIDYSPAIALTANNYRRACQSYSQDHVKEAFGQELSIHCVSLLRMLRSIIEFPCYKKTTPEDAANIAELINLLPSATYEKKLWSVNFAAELFALLLMEVRSYPSNRPFLLLLDGLVRSKTDLLLCYHDWDDMFPGTSCCGLEDCCYSLGRINWSNDSYKGPFPGITLALNRYRARARRENPNNNELLTAIDQMIAHYAQAVANITPEQQAIFNQERNSIIEAREQRYIQQQQDDTNVIKRCYNKLVRWLGINALTRRIYTKIKKD